MNWSELRKKCRIALTVVLGSVLLLAGLAKLSDYQNFLGYLTQIRGMPHIIAAVLGVVVPSLELSFGAVLLIGAFNRSHLWGIILLFSVFLAFQIGAALPGANLVPAPCPCFAKLDPFSGWQWHVSRGVAFLALAVVRLRLESRAELTAN